MPEAEGIKILGVVKSLLSKKVLIPTCEGQAAAARDQRLPAAEPVPGRRVLRPPSWELTDALAVELEHDRDRGMNVTMNHPLLTGLVALAHPLATSGRPSPRPARWRLNIH